MRRLILFMSVLVFVITAFASCRYTDQISIVDDSVKNEQEIDTTETEGSNPSQSKKLIHGIDIVKFPDILYATPEYEALTEGQKIACVALAQTLDDIINNGPQVNKEYPLNARISDSDRMAAFDFFYSTFPDLNDIMCFIVPSDSQGSQDFCDVFYLANLDNSDQFENIISEGINKYREWEAMTDEILSSLDHDGTDRGKALSIARWMVDNILYPVDYEIRLNELCSVYTTLKSKEAICQGYSVTFEYLCRKAGIKAICVLGDTSFGGHMWNMVSLNGKWYHADITWMDDDSDKNSFFRYFLIPDEIVSIDHLNIKCSSDIMSLPVANSYDMYAYYYESYDDLIRYFSNTKLDEDVPYLVCLNSKTECERLKESRNMLFENAVDNESYYISLKKDIDSTRFITVYFVRKK